MKKYCKVLMQSIVCLAIVLTFGLTTFTAQAKTKPLDEIQDYDITVNMRPDGTMDIHYDIEWLVLDSTSQGPLEWVKIGCPNSHVDQITALTDNIQSIKYMSENGGSYIRIDFKRKYSAGEVAKFSYSIHQSYMYTIEEDNHLCRYSFTPGWFEEIEVDHIRIRWDDSNVIESNARKSDDGYLIWEGSLEMNERLNASVKYNLDTFDTDPDKQYKEGDDISIGKVLLVILVIAIVILVLLWIFGVFDDDGYSGRSGFGGRRTTYIHTSSCARSSCACVSCACACACAGGGRAGCSLKDFYRTNLKTENLEQTLKQTKQK